MTDVTTLLAGIKARAEKATEGPWEVDRNYPFTSDLVGIFAPGPKHYILQVENQDDVDDPTSDEDIQFLAAARTDVPRLVAALDAVAGLHYEDLFRGHLSNGCKTCGHDYPCPTITAVAAALGGGEGQ